MKCYKRVGYNLNLMQHVCKLLTKSGLIIMIPSLIERRWVGVSLYDDIDLGRGFFVFCLAHRVSTGDFLLLQIFSGVI